MVFRSVVLALMTSGSLATASCATNSGEKKRAGKPGPDKDDVTETEDKNPPQKAEEKVDLDEIAAHDFIFKSDLDMVKGERQATTLFEDSQFQTEATSFSYGFINQKAVDVATVYDQKEGCVLQVNYNRGSEPAEVVFPKDSRLTVSSQAVSERNGDSTVTLSIFYT
jgi:hypothetical protein